jgi:ATP-GRASP peptide maturase of grasp-with-spasm system
MILIISIYNDYSTTTVIEWLNFFNKKWIRINEDDKINLDFMANDVIFNVNNTSFNLSEIKSCRYRRGFLNFTNNPEDLISSFSNFVTKEFNHVEKYIYHKLKSNKTINDFGNSTINKLIVSDIARNLKLKTPKDYLVNSKIILESIILQNQEQFITKSISGYPSHKFNNFTLYNFTQKVNLQELNTSKFSLSLVQNYIEKQFELRIFYLHRIFYSMAIFSQTNPKTIVDFRNYDKDLPNRTVPFKLPKKIEIKLEKLMNNLKLNCGSIDMIVDKEDEYYFLEVNPIGQFGMVSNPCNYNLNKVIAEYL